MDNFAAVVRTAWADIWRQLGNSAGMRMGKYAWFEHGVRVGMELERKHPTNEESNCE